MTTKSPLSSQQRVGIIPALMSTEAQTSPIP